jgi:hypothetical protein
MGGPGLASVEVMLRSVPLVMQFASPELAEDILYGERDWTDDPRWLETGAPDLGSYGHWAVRWCGIACLRMALLARDDAAPSLYELAVGAKRYGAYSDAPGAPEGLIYRPFVDYVRAEHGLHAEVATDFAAPALCRSVQGGSLVIASVHPEIRRPQRPSPGRGGHLVLVTAAEADTLTFNDPSGHHLEARVATLPVVTFDTFFARRGVILHA